MAKVEKGGSVKVLLVQLKSCWIGAGGPKERQSLEKENQRRGRDIPELNEYHGSCQKILLCSEPPGKLRARSQVKTSSHDSALQ